MRKVTVFKIGKKGNDYDIYVPAGTNGRDIEIGLAQAFIGIANHERKNNPDFKTKTLIRSVELWVEQLEEM